MVYLQIMTLAMISKTITRMTSKMRNRRVIKNNKTMLKITKIIMI